MRAAAGVATAVRVAAAVLVGSAGWAGFTGSPAMADEIRDAQWHLEQLSVTEAHEVSVGAGILVAVLDSGVDASHPDLAGNVVPGIDLTGGGSDGRDDPTGTGTALAGLIAGRGNGPAAAGGSVGADGVPLPPDGALGIAPYAQILPVAVTRPGSTPAPVTVAAGIERAHRSGAEVICLGHALPDHPDVIQAVGEAISGGAVVVIPAGTDNEAFARYAGLGLLSAQPIRQPDPAPEPESEPESDSDPESDSEPDSEPGAEAGSESSASGLPPGAVAVPGPGVLSTGSQGGYFVYERTGAAAGAGVLAGAVALVWAAHPDLLGHQVTDRIVATTSADDLDLVAAVTAEVAANPQAPPGPPADPADPDGSDPEGSGSDGGPEAVAAFDSDDWRRWLVAAPLVTFLIVLATASTTAARRARRQNLLTSARAGNNEY